MCPRTLELLSSYTTNHEDVSISLFLRVNHVLTFSELFHDRSFSYSAGWKRRLELSGFSLSMIYVYQLLITQVIVFFWNLIPVTLWVTFRSQSMPQRSSKLKVIPYLPFSYVWDYVAYRSKSKFAFLIGLFIFHDLIILYSLSTMMIAESNN